MEEAQRVELEPGVRVGDLDLFAVARTVRRPAGRGRCAAAVLWREAVGVIVRDVSGLRVLMADGRTLTPAQLVDELPSLRSAVSALRRSDLEA